MMVVENLPKMIGMVFALVSLFTLVYLFYRNTFNKKIGYLFLSLSTLMGFLVFAPMFPNQFQLLVLGNTDKLGAPIQIAVIGFLLFIVLTFVFGRMFCGYLCPIGAVQELAYSIPIKKMKITNKTLPVIFRLIFAIAFIVLGVFFSTDVLAHFGFRDFFYLHYMALFFYIFAALILLSVFTYRPFCRFFCPYGVLLSFASMKSIFRLRRNDACIDCKKCEIICPTHEAGRFDLKQECYLCNRCKDVCPTNAIEYNRQEVKE